MRGRVLMFGMALAASTVARAGDVSPEALAHEKAGTTAYQLAKFQEAIDEYTKAYEIGHAPVMLFNIGQAHRLKGEPERALHFYRMYLSAAPTGRHQETAEEKIVELDRVVAEQKRLNEEREKARTGPPVGVGGAKQPESIEPSKAALTEPAPEVKKKKKAGFPAWGGAVIVAVGVVLVGGAVGVGVGVSANSGPPTPFTNGGTYTVQWPQ